MENRGGSLQKMLGYKKRRIQINHEVF